MKNEFDGNTVPSGNESEQELHQHRSTEDRFHYHSHSNGSRFTFWNGLDLLARRWGWLFLGALLGGAGLGVLGVKFLKPKYTATGHLLRYETPASKEFFKDILMTGDTFAGLMRSPTLLSRVGDAMKPPLAPDKLNKCIKIEPEVDSDMVKVLLMAGEPQVAVDSLNIYLQEAEKFTKEFQQEQARGLAYDFLKSQVTQMDEDITALSQYFRGRAGFGPLTNKLNQVGTNLNALSSDLARSTEPSALVDIRAQRLNSALAELNELMVKFTDLAPQVQAQKSLVDDLQKQLEKARTNGSPALLSGSVGA